MTPYRSTGFILHCRGMRSIGTSELAKRAGVNVETVRFYERTGLLPEPPRTPSGYRRFSPDAIRVVRFVKRAQELGFSLTEIKDLLSLRARPGATCEDVRRRAEAKIHDVDAKIRSLQAVRRALKRLAAECSGRGPVEACPILERLDPKGFGNES